MLIQRVFRYPSLVARPLSSRWGTSVLAAPLCCTLVAAQLPIRRDIPTVQQDRSESCSEPAHRQFDFWSGDWDVRNPAGQLVGTNRIEIILGGCALAETWTSAGPHRGVSINFYDESTARWHQTWIGNDGQALYLDGSVQEGEMVLQGTGVARDGTKRIERITWTPNADGSVRQHWEISTDGTEWRTIFDGKYVRRSAAKEPGR